MIMVQRIETSCATRVPFPDVVDRRARNTGISAYSVYSLAAYKLSRESLTPGNGIVQAYLL